MEEKRRGKCCSPVAAARNDARTAVRIRPVVKGDLPVARRLIEAADLPTEGVEAHFEQGFVVAVIDGDIVGTAGIEAYGRYALLRSVAVADAYRARGIGRALVRDRLELAAKRGWVAVFLLTLEPAYFYRFGFRPVDRNSVPVAVWQSPEFAHICPDSAVAMARPVDHERDARREAVRRRYGAIARDLEPGSTVARSAAAPVGTVQFGASAYPTEAIESAPGCAAAGSLGSGNPVAVAQLTPGEVVLDLGSGAGLDVLLAAERVGHAGRVVGIDMTEEMIEAARRHQRDAGADNVEFLQAPMEALPLPDHAVDVVLSNCVINLSPDKRAVLAEAFRVLRPGGRFVVSDIVALTPVPDAMRRDAALWAGCVSGAIEVDDYVGLLQSCGFRDIDVEVQGEFDASSDSGCGCGDGGSDATSGDAVRLGSAIIRATKPLV